MHLNQDDADAQEFAQWLLEVGHGRNMDTNSQVCFPNHMRVDDLDSLISSIYPGIDSTPPPPPDYFLNQMILAPRNADVGDIIKRFSSICLEIYANMSVLMRLYKSLVLILWMTTPFQMNSFGLCIHQAFHQENST
jgi:hypothetical protein